MYNFLSRGFSRGFSSLCRPFGYHTIIDLKKCDKALVSDKESIRKYVVKLCDIIRMDRYGEAQIVKFGEDPRLAGYSLTQLITTSNISGHFVDATGEAYIDIFSCKDYDGKLAATFTKEYFNSEDYTYQIITRK